MNYKFKFKNGWFWKTKVVMGHWYEEKQDKMVLYYPDGSLEEIAHWKDCCVKLGTDWKLVTQKRMEAEAGQSVPLKV